MNLLITFNEAAMNYVKHMNAPSSWKNNINCFIKKELSENFRNKMLGKITYSDIANFKHPATGIVNNILKITLMEK